MLEKQQTKGPTFDGKQISDDKILDGSIFDDIAAQIKEIEGVVQEIHETDFKEQMNKTVQKIKHLREFSDDLKDEYEFANMQKRLIQEFDNKPPEIDHGATPEEVLKSQKARQKATQLQRRKSLIFSHDQEVIT
eukprot:TRINITY_DN22453_c0_g2_i6.p2 TRINITY_DN22453_c0_g2~~TRINITY_DN22453_c0_g2_i6.p2  ORF type:complete len:134 (-),score=18.38 TRINITY_DN22453_c0_g2_i6:277-678(-)